MAAPLLVGAVWIAMAIAAEHFVAAHADPVPYMDDYALVDAITGDAPVTPRWL